MYKLEFNTATKTVIVFSDQNSKIFSFNNVPTVKIEPNYYEVIQKDKDERIKPVLRLPIANTIMVIKH